MREARERQAFKDSIETVLSAKEGQGVVLAQREINQDQVRQGRTEQAKHQKKRFGKESQKYNAHIIRHVRDGRPERTR